MKLETCLPFEWPLFSWNKCKQLFGKLLFKSQFYWLLNNLLFLWAALVRAIQLNRLHSQSRLDIDDSRERVRIRYTIVRYFFTCKIDEDNWCTLFTRSHWIRRQQIRFMLFWCCLAVRIAMCSHRFSHYLITRLIHTRMKTNAHLSP